MSRAAIAAVTTIGAARTGTRQGIEVLALLDPAFLAEAGWDGRRLILEPAPEHPLLGRPVCRVAGCASTAPTRDHLCVSCRRLAPDGDTGDDAIAVMATRRASAKRRRWGGELSDPSGCGSCQVVACDRPSRNRDGAYCVAHQQRWRRAASESGWQSEARWLRTEPPVSVAGRIVMRGMTSLAIAQVLRGLQQRCRLDGVITKDHDLRRWCNELRSQQAASLGDYTPSWPQGQPEGTFTAMVNSITARARLAMASPETEIASDTWDLAVFGQNGTLPFAQITQPWLREAAKRWAADDLPRRRVRPGGRRTSSGLAVRHHIGCVARLSASLRMRPDHGLIPAALDRQDMEAFLHRLSYQVSAGQISADARIRACREVRAVLSHLRAIGLTRPGASAHGLGDNFAVYVSDIPAKPDKPEHGRDLPAEIMQQICAHLPEVTTPEMRTAFEIAIDTGRRPEEICSLRYDCLTRDHDDAPVLVYDNHKADRPARRLPISQNTAVLIAEQQQRVRSRYPATPAAELVLLPTDRRNPHGDRAITGFSMSFHHRTWVGRMPILHTADGIEFDKTRIVLYAYRHTYAQRHADAGVPIDVLRQLMDHRKLDTTKCYYHVGETRRREAVDRVAELQFDRHGNRIWRTAQALLDSEHARRAVAQVAVPFGLCAEPSNVQAGGNACPYRFRCTGCDHFRTDISYLPDLQAYLDDLLRNRERVLAAVDIDTWARTEALPSEEEISRIRRLINRVQSDLDELTSDEQAQITHAVTVIRKHRTVTLGMPSLRLVMPNTRQAA